MKQGLLYLLMGLAMTGCTTKESFVLFNDTDVSKAHAKRTVVELNDSKYEYIILPNDRVSLTMYNHPELGTSTVQSQREDTRGVLVNSKGYVRLPLIKSIHIAGLTQTAAQKKIEKAFSAFLEDAEVYLEVLNKRAYVLGEVKNPGVIELEHEKISLLQLIAHSGGFADGANREAIVVMKKRDNKVITQTVDLLGTNSLKMANMTIYPNDTVYVSPNSMRSYNVGVTEIAPTFGLLGTITQPIVNTKFLIK